MITFRHIVFSSFVLMIFLAGCMGPSEEYIQGRWEYQSEHLSNIPAESHLHVTWEFYGGSFYYYYCCFNAEIELTGHYRVLSNEENNIDLELYDVKGAASRINSEIRIKIDPDTDTLTIMGTSPFIRLTPP
jgi:hypothetical protein